jgi:hypothetical protein
MVDEARSFGNISLNVQERFLYFRPDRKSQFRMNDLFLYLFIRKIRESVNRVAVFWG